MAHLIHVNAALQHLCLFYATSVGMAPVQSIVKKRSVMVGRRKTSISLENEFWDALNMIVRARNTSMSRLLESIAEERAQGEARTLTNLSSAVRIFVLEYYRRK
jgi:predicted DNA-binding ribbon-helix-helix protein